jgi:hypothetical protein
MKLAEGPCALDIPQHQLRPWFWIEQQNKAKRLPSRNKCRPEQDTESSSMKTQSDYKVAEIRCCALMRVKYLYLVQAPTTVVRTWNCGKQVIFSFFSRRKTFIFYSFSLFPCKVIIFIYRIGI